MNKEYRIGLVGFFGWGNFGDELFLEAHRRNLGHLGVVESINDLTKKPYFSEPLENIINRYDAFVIGGGDLIVPWTVSELYWKLEYLNKPVFIVGVGVPTWRGMQPKAMKHYQAFMQSDAVKLLLARDVQSARWINKHIEPTSPALWYPDLCCALDYPQVPDPKDSKPVLGIVLRQRGQNTDDLGQVRNLCDRAKQQGYDIRHIVLGSKGVGEKDFAVAKAFAEAGEEIRYSEDVLEMCAEIGRCTALASMKFHGTVVAAMYGIPSIVLTPTDKNRNFLQMIERPDLKCTFGDPNLADKISEDPVPVSKEIRDKMKAGAREGYARLDQAIRNTLG